jgi:DNA-binding NarL/FixJ family response regulator/archaellum biogenesis ATPase FlaH
VISTGTEALDERFGALKPGQLYSFFGPAAAGKSILALHYLMEGLSRGERCVLVTPAEPAMIESRALYMGRGGVTLMQHPLLRIVQVVDRDLAPNGSTRELLEQWLTTRSADTRPSRIVFDGIESLPEYARTPHALVHELKMLLERTGATAYALVQTQRGSSIDVNAHDSLLSHSAGAFCLHVRSSGERRFEFLAAPHGAFRTDNFPFSLRVGAGFTEDISVETPQASAAERRTVIVLDEIGALPDDVLESLRQSYELEVLNSATGALSRLSEGRYGALVLTVDPFEETRAFDLVNALRREGNSAPVVCAAPSRGLRSTTRSRGLRAGADDFFVTDLPPAEMVERIQMAWVRGTHRRSGFSQIGQIMQPVGDDAAIRPMSRAELSEAMSTLLAEQPPLFFCYLEFMVPFGTAGKVWSSLRSRLRTGDGDLIGLVSDRVFGCVLDRITAEQTLRVMERIRSAHPDLNAADNVLVLASPVDASTIRRRFELGQPDEDGTAPQLSALEPA